MHSVHSTIQYTFTWLSNEYHCQPIWKITSYDANSFLPLLIGTGKLGFSFVRITALLVSNYRLWMGTGNGVIISVPLNRPRGQRKEGEAQPTSTAPEPIGDALSGKPALAPGEALRVYTDAKGERVVGETFIPYCNMAQAQLSFHGHRDAVKFFVSVPGTRSIGFFILYLLLFCNGIYSFFRTRWLGSEPHLVVLVLPDQGPHLRQGGLLYARHVWRRGVHRLQNR